MRPSTAYGIVLLACLAGLGAVFVHAPARQRAALPAIREKREIVRALGLTDLCLFTDARYSRHPAVADRFTPFQDHPSSLEHFPSASILSPPPHLRGR